MTAVDPPAWPSPLDAFGAVGMVAVAVLIVWRQPVLCLLFDERMAWMVTAIASSSALLSAFHVWKVGGAHPAALPVVATFLITLAPVFGWPA